MFAHKTKCFVTKRSLLLDFGNTSKFLKPTNGILLVKEKGQNGSDMYFGTLFCLFVNTIRAPRWHLHYICNEERMGMLHYPETMSVYCSLVHKLSVDS